VSETEVEQRREPTPFDPAGRRVLVTGSSSGLGAALAVGLAERGAVVGVCGRRTDRLEAVLELVRRHSPDSRAWTVDLADLDGIDAFARRVVEDLGGLDVLVNNAGIPKRRWAWEHRPDEITQVLRINVESPIRLTQALLGELDRRDGHVVFIGSVAARLSPPNEAVYSASKAAVTAYAEGLRVDLGVAGSSLGVHVVQPGVLTTELFTLPDNDPSLSDVEPLDAGEIVGAVLGVLGSGRVEGFVPGWFADLPPVKAGDLDGFLQGSVDYTRSRLEALGLNRPSGPGTPT
jgi:NAD(P)-dependent dehydrogenase (short-subunit alcohol dehydrogenase family)